MRRVTAFRVFLTVCGVLALAVGTDAQRGRGGAGAAGPPPTAQAVAGEDLTGYWVSVITEDWRWRMMTPAKGDFASLPLTAEGRRVGEQWDPATETAEDKCKAYGVGGLLRVPTRLHVTWEDPNTLKLETDAGTQTRYLRFAGRGAAAPATAVPSDRTLQGNSVATWEYAGGRNPRGGGPAPVGQLKVVTTGMKAGYLRRNGAPYSQNAVVTEFFNKLDESDGSNFMVVSVTVEDPQYLNARFTVSNNFKKEPDGSKWHPTPCE